MNKNIPVLNGFPYSNYYNIPKHVLLYKGVEFEENLVYPNEENYAELNPARKVPSLTTSDGHHLAEASVLCEYIEEAYPQKPLLPSDPIARNKVRQIMRIAELYLELPNRKLIPYDSMKKQPPEVVLRDIRMPVESAVNSINALASFDPWLTGDQITMADIYFYYVLTVTDLGGRMTGINLGERIPGLNEWRTRFDSDPITQSVAADRDANKESFHGYLKSVFGS